MATYGSDSRKAWSMEKRDDDRLERSARYLPESAAVFFREPVGFDSEIFYQWAQIIVLEKGELVKVAKHLVLSLQ